MKAYKAFNDDLTCMDFQYEIGKTYTMNEKPIPCKQGFHACLDLEDVFGYYDPIDKIRICEVEMNGINIEHDRPQDLDILVNDSSHYVRKEVAKQGRTKDLDILIKDKSWYVRYLVTEQGRPKDLDILVNDSSHYVRKKVARHGRPQDLEILIHDEDSYVREVAIAMFEKLKTERV